MLQAKGTAPLLECCNVSQHFVVRHGLLKRIQGYIHAVEDVSLCVYPGETFGLVGESGCGKSTLSRMIVGLLQPTKGNIFLHGQSILDMKHVGTMRHKLQMVFQDPFSSLNPRLSIGHSIAEPLTVARVGKQEKEHRVEELLQYVGLQPEQKKLYPHEFSGGQRQRVAIARALATHPDLLVCDEAVSALDASVQAQVLNLLKDLQSTFGLTYFFISHDIAVVGYMSDRIAVMYLGRIMEIAPTEALLSSPAHPYTQVLLEAIPVPDPTCKRSVHLRSGEMPSALNPPLGCPFYSQCMHAMPECKDTLPNLVKLERTTDFGVERYVRCHLYV